VATTFPSGRRRLRYYAKHKTGIPRFLFYVSVPREDSHSLIRAHTLARANINTRRIHNHNHKHIALRRASTIDRHNRKTESLQHAGQSLSKSREWTVICYTDEITVLTLFTLLHRSLLPYRRCCWLSLPSAPTPHH